MAVRASLSGACRGDHRLEIIERVEVFEDDPLIPHVGLPTSASSSIFAASRPIPELAPVTTALRPDILGGASPRG